MVVTATDTPTQAEVLLLVEATSANGAYINELKANYIIPTLEYFHGGPIEEGGGNGSVYGVVAYRSADSQLGVPVSTYGPFTCPQKTIETIDKIQYVCGRAESRACITEALSTALACLEEMGRNDMPRHILLLGCSPPYSAYGGGLVPAGCPATIEQAARLTNERGAQLSVISARRTPALLSLYENAGGDLHSAQQRNYAKDPKHLVLLRGYSLKERPPSPAPPPAPEIQPDVYGPRAAPPAARPAAPFPPRPPRAAWLAPPRHSIYANNSALLTQLAQPSYPPPTPTQPHNTLQRMPMLGTPGPSNAPAPPLAAPAAPLAAPAPPQRTYIWSGVLEWMEKGKGPGDQQKSTKHLPCQVSANSKDIEPELKVDTWPNKLLMQLMPKQLISNIGGQYLKDSKSVLFHLQPNEALDALTKVMVNGFAGCVHFSPMSSPPQCDIKVLILLYTPDKNAYLGFIPNNQATFVDRLRKVIQQQKITQIINKQMPGVSAASPLAGAMPAAGMANTSMPGGNSMQGGGMSGGSGLGGVQGGAGMGGGSMGGGGMGGGGMGGGGMGGGSMGGGSMGGVSQLPPPAQPMQQHPQQNMMLGGGMQAQGGGGKGGRGQVQLDGLEAARQQNIEKIQQLQQSLEAAHQQEAQFKSQLDIMTHLQAAQQQEQHYKQLEEQQRKHQMQQQLQQQLRGAGAARGMRPMMPSNPGLRHLLQQQQQQQAARGPRPHM